MESALNSQQKSDLREQAAEWFLAREQGLDPARMQQFARWLATSPAHLAEYHAMERLARDLPLAMGAASPVDELVEQVRSAPDRDDPIPFPPRPSPRPAVLQRNRPFALAAVFAFVAVGVVLLWPNMKELVAPQAPALRFASPHGKVLQHEIAPGFKFQLDTDSEVVLSSNRKGRQARLASGGVTFEIKHDPGTVNEVLAGPARVVDVGTKFEVYLLPDDAVRVTVVDGEVEVSSKDASGTRRVGRDQQIIVVPGQALTEPVAVDASRAMSWSRGEVFLDGVHVDDAVKEFNRYLVKPIRIDSGTLGGEVIHHDPVSTGDVDAFLDFLRSSLGAKVDRSQPGQIVVTSR